MDRTFRRSGLSLALAGAVGIVFFWLSDPRLSPLHIWKADNPIDQANQMMIGTVVGALGSLVVLVIGLWLMTRRSD